jgi:YHS domain-containing protein
MFSKLACPLLLIIAATACNNGPKKEITSPAFSHTDTTKVAFTQAMVDFKNDPSCGMPLSAGIGDTVHYKGKVYGFCSDECRDIFLKNPDSVARLAVLK